MSEERIADGVERIEQALARIKAAATRPAPAGASEGANSAELEALQARHATFRDEVAGALRELDEVLTRG